MHVFDSSTFSSAQPIQQNHRTSQANGLFSSGTVDERCSRFTLCIYFILHGITSFYIPLTFQTLFSYTKLQFRSFVRCRKRKSPTCRPLFSVFRQLCCRSPCSVAICTLCLFGSPPVCMLKISRNKFTQLRIRNLFREEQRKINKYVCV